MEPFEKPPNPTRSGLPKADQGEKDFASHERSQQPRNCLKFDDEASGRSIGLTTVRPSSSHRQNCFALRRLGLSFSPPRPTKPQNSYRNCKNVSPEASSALPFDGKF